MISKKKYQNVQLKIFNFCNLGKICISHGRVFVMDAPLSTTKARILTETYALQAQCNSVSENVDIVN